MLTIIYEDGDVLTTTLPITPDFLEQVSVKKSQHLSPLSVSAHSDEHEHILIRFDGLPFGRHGFTVWPGEWARFIIANIQNLV
jgi:hypothetical protein